MTQPVDRCRALADAVIDATERGLSDAAVHLINRLAASRRVSPHHLALAVPGACHGHGPDARHTVPGCAYCRRRGNCFAGATAAG